MIRKLIAAVAVVALVAAPASAGKFNKVVSVGDAAPAITGLQATDGKSYSMDSFKDKDVVVVIFTCNHCPVAVDYEDRIIEFTKKHAGAGSKVGVVAISCNKGEADGLDAMKVRAEKKGFNFVYAFNEGGKVGKSYGATKTPEFFVLNKERKIVYMGAMDDSNKPDNVKKNYLEEAVKATLAGETVKTAETQARGCGIRY